MSDQPKSYSAFYINAWTVLSIVLAFVFLAMFSSAIPCSTSARLPGPSCAGWPARLFSLNRVAPALRAAVLWRESALPKNSVILSSSKDL